MLSPFSSLRSTLSPCALAASSLALIACAQGSTALDVGYGDGGRGGAASTTTTSAATTGGAGGQTTTTETTSTSTTSTTTTTTTTSTTTTTTSTTTTTTSTTTGGSACDNQGSCDACGGCADMSFCTSLGDACYQDGVCWDLFWCIWDCTSSACVNQCISLLGDATALALFTPYNDCILCSCVSDCDVTGCP